MAKKEKFGKLVLLERIDQTGLGEEFRAAKLGPAGLEKIVSILKLQPLVSGKTEFARALMDQAKVAAQLQNPNVLKIFGIGKVGETYYITYELVEGRSLRAVLERCRQEGFPFSPDHALLIASKVCSALEYAHARKTEGVRYFHGLLTPASVLVSFEGEVRLKGFGYWPSKVRETGALVEDDLRYLAPEQAAGGVGDTRSDVYALGAILFETLTGTPPSADDMAARVTGAKLQSPPTDDDSLPKPLRDPQEVPGPRSRRPLRRSPGDAQGRRHPALLRRLHAHDLQPRLLHALAVPRRHRARRTAAQGGARGELRRVPDRRREGGRGARRGRGRARDVVEDGAHRPAP